MKPTSKQPEQLSKLLDQLEHKLSEIEGKNSFDSRTEKTQGKKNQKAASGSSSSVSVPTTPRLASGTKSTEKAALAFDGSKVNGDPHTTPIKRAKLERKIEIKKEEVIQRPKKSSDGEGSSSSHTPRAVRFATLDATTPVSHRSAAPTPTSTPAATPRTVGLAKDDSSSESSSHSKTKSPRTTQFRKTVSRGASKAALAIGKFGEKIVSQVSSVSTSTPATPKSSGRNSPEVQSSTRSSGKSNPYPENTPSIKNPAARSLLTLESDEGYKNSGDTRKKFMLHSELIKVLMDNNIEINAPRLKFLQKEAVERSVYTVVDQIIDLADPQYLDLVNRVVDGAFIKTWDRDNSTFDDSELKKYLQFVQPSFARDFSHSNYEIKNSDGSIKKLNSIDEFIEFIGPGSEGNLPKVVSNIASQNLGLFLKPVLFFREQKGKIPESVLHLDDGTPIRPNVNFRQKYTFSKNDDGKIIIDYESNALKEFQIGKPMKIAKNNGGLALDVNDATIKIKVRIEVNPDGRWYINNPHVVAENWNNVVS